MESKKAKQVDPTSIPGVNPVKKEIKFEKVSLKNVRVKKDENTEFLDVEVEIVPFDPFNDDHVEFAYSHADMFSRAPSRFSTLSDAAKGYVAMFMKHGEEDEKNTDSVYNAVLNDVRACRTLFHQERIQKALFDFFENA